MNTHSFTSFEYRRLQPLLARLSLLLVILLTLWLAVRWLLLLISGPDIEVRMPALPTQVQQRSSVSASGNNIAALHLFGQAGAANPLHLTMLPETSLDLELRGIVAAVEQDQQGYAIIISSDGREWVYGVGDRLSDDTEVVAITSQQVVLQRHGQRETLSLPRLAAEQSGAGIRRSQAATPGNQANRSSTSPVAGGSLVGAGVPGLTAINGAGMLPFTATAGSIAGVNLDSTNLARMAQMIQVTPAAGGGYQVFPGRDAVQFQQLGLQANDVITAVNGQPLTNVQAAMQIFQNLGAQNSVTLSVRRNGQVVQLQPDLSALKQQ
ncbi:MAG: PDZ domain-containing protein [Gammaproteobacteria bacterium]|jgi:general secretion pathway protein C|nr:PDZ domain-containing protein [Gammaproteobacteria bacterium]